VDQRQGVFLPAFSPDPAGFFFADAFFLLTEAFRVICTACFLVREGMYRQPVVVGGTGDANHSRPRLSRQLHGDG
jgi:hypothetical protein